MRALVEEKNRVYVGHFSFPLVGDLDCLGVYLQNRIKDTQIEVQKIINEYDISDYEFQFEVDREEIKSTYINIYLVFKNDAKEIKEEIIEHKTAIKELQRRLKELDN